MEQTLAVVTTYLATVLLGTVACKTAPQRLIVRPGLSKREFIAHSAGRRCFVAISQSRDGSAMFLGSSWRYSSPCKGPGFQLGHPASLSGAPTQR